MDEIEFTLDGTRYHLSREAVIRAMRKQVPGRIQTWATDIEGVRFPVKQVLAQALQIPVTAFISTRAQELLRKLDFEVINLELEDEQTGSSGSPALRRTALELAVAHAGTRSSMTSEDIVKLARQFHNFLEAQA